MDSLDRGVGVRRADDELELRVDAGLLLGRGADERNRADTLTVKTKVLSERLAEKDLVALLNEVADGEGVAVDVARGEALVGHVEEGEVLLGLDDLGELLPLLLGGVDTGGVLHAVSH